MFPVDSKQPVSFGGTSVKYGLLLLGQDVEDSVNTTYKIAFCNWFLIETCAKVDNAMS